MHLCLSLTVTVIQMNYYSRTEDHFKLRKHLSTPRLTWMMTIDRSITLPKYFNVLWFSSLKKTHFFKRSYFFHTNWHVVIMIWFYLFLDQLYEDWTSWPFKKSPHDKLFETFVINLATLEKSTEGSRLTRFLLNPNSLKHNICPS